MKHNAIRKIKKLIPLYFKSLYKVKKIKYDIRDLIEELNNKDSRIILIGTPIHKNMGDHLIALAEKQFLSYNYKDKRIIEIPQDVYRVYKRKISARIVCSDYLFISGGGWLGNVWEPDDRFVRDLLYLFPENNKLIFPQTLYFDKKRKNYDKVLQQWKSTIKKVKRFKICLREKNSYNFAISVLDIPVENCLLLPDIGLLYQRNKGPQKRERIGIIFRDDIESVMSKSQRLEIQEILSKIDQKKDFFSTISDSLIGVDIREKQISDLLVRFSKCKWIVTDRLHGLIFSVLTDTPCIVFDNLTQKVSGVYETWLSESRSIYLVNSIQQFKSALNTIGDYQYDEYQHHNFIKDYDKLVLSINTDLGKEREKNEL